MSTAKKRGLISVITVIITALLFILFNKYYNVQPISLNIEIKSDRPDRYQVYYDTEGNKEWSEENSSVIGYSGSNKLEDLKFNIPIDTKNVRIDFGTMPSNITVGKFYFKKGIQYNISSKDLQGLKKDLVIENSDNRFNIKSNGDDPYLEIENVNTIVNDWNNKAPLTTCFMILGSLILGLITAKSFMWFRESLNFIKLAIKNRGLIKSLSKNDFKNKYATSYLGIVWGFIQPLVTIAVYWFVFQVGFRSGDVGDAPFILWFIAGIIPWFFFSDALPSTTGVFTEYSYLVKKVVFKIEILPLVKIVSALFVQLFFILFIYVISSAYGYYPDIYSLQFIYYSFAMIVLVYSIAIITSSIVLFFRDLSQIIGILISVGFWATPIGWQLDMIPDWAARIFKLNPMYYIVTGYRDAFVDKIFFWDRPYETIYFWMFCLVTLLVGVKVFNKLKPHFSDVI